MLYALQGCFNFAHVYVPALNDFSISMTNYALCSVALKSSHGSLCTKQAIKLCHLLYIQFSPPFGKEKFNVDLGIKSECFSSYLTTSKCFTVYFTCIVVD